MNYSYNYTAQSISPPIKDNEHTNASVKRKDWYLLTAGQIIIFLLFVLSIFLAILLYCKACTRPPIIRRSEYSAYRSERSDSINSRSLQFNSIYELADRPPSYNEACNAPPLYESPYNTVSMLEAPPVYPETPKASERVSHTFNQGFPITHHI
ncbi:hypothetical protein ANTPLA_LOCUS477 [Anthophora plagiata]